MEQLKHREQLDLLNSKRASLEEQKLAVLDEEYKHFSGLFLYSIGILAVPVVLFCLSGDAPGWFIIILILFAVLMGACVKFSFDFYVEDRKRLKTINIDLASIKQELITETDRVHNFEKKYHIEEVKFYLTCKSQGIEHISTEAGKARLELYAQNNHIDFSDKLISEYLTGQKYLKIIQNEEDNRRKKQHLEELRQNEESEEQHIKRYINYTGREKRIKMYQELAEYWRKQEEEGKKQASALFAASFAAVNAVAYEKEHDWAIAGGLANGLAGGAAGLATALDIQQKNAEIRARNSMPRDYSLAMSIGDRAGAASRNEQRAKEEAEKYENLAREVQNLLIENNYTLEEQRTLLAHLKPRIEVCDPVYGDESDVEITETGAITLCVDTCPYTLKIKGSVQAVVDGYYKVIVMNRKNNSIIGEAFAYLPISGSLNKDRCYTICRANTSLKAEDLMFDFEPYNLWAIEVGTL